MENKQYKKIKFTGERMVNHQKSFLYKISLDRYKFALKLINTKDTVLDIACGSGYGTNLLCQKAKKIIGVDNDNKTINYCRSKYKNNKIKFIKLNAEVKKLEFKNYFDSIISFETIEHLKKYNNFLVNLNFYLKPKGTIILSTPNNYLNKKIPSNKFHHQEFYIKDIFCILKKIFKHSEITVYGQNKTSILSNIKNFKENNIRQIISLVFKNIYDFDQKYLKLFNKLEHFSFYQKIGNIQRRDKNNTDIYKIDLSKDFFQPNISIFIIKKIK